MLNPWKSYRRIGLTLAISTIAALPCGGCGGAKEGPAEVSETAGMPEAKDALQDLAEMLKRFAAGNEPPPATDEDFAKYDAEHPAIATLIANRTVVYNYGAVVSEANSGSKWVGMQANAKEGGGWVLLDNGQVRNMSADEIKALQPAK